MTHYHDPRSLEEAMREIRESRKKIKELYAVINAQRVPMTEDEIFDMWRNGDTSGGGVEFEDIVRIVEAHHKIK